MHELSIAASIVEALLEFGLNQGVSKVLEVRLAVGELAGIEEEQLRFCFGAITHDTALENASVIFEAVPAAVRCPYCLYEGKAVYWDDLAFPSRCPTLQCPQCGSAAEAIAGHDCAIKSLRFIRQPALTVLPSTP